MTPITMQSPHDNTAEHADSTEHADAPGMTHQCGSAQPGYFGTNNSLFGWLHIPERSNGQEPVVICAPVGYEQVRAFRSVKCLASRLTTAGFTVLRFDYHGCGDSAGDALSSATVSRWQQDINDAIKFVCQATKQRAATLVGIRLGATLAATVAESTAVAKLVLWQPCESGKAYIREMEIVQAANEKKHRSTAKELHGGLDAGGFLFSTELQRDIRKLVIGKDAFAGKPPILLLERSDIRSTGRLARALGDSGSHVEIAPAEGFKEMMLAPQVAILPSNTIADIVEWLSIVDETTSVNATIDDAQTDSDPASLNTSLAPSMPLGEVLEEVVRFGDDRRLFGICTRPARNQDATTRAIVMLCGGSVPRYSANRMYVPMARALAGDGATVLRMDLSGIGDSVARVGEPVNKPYTNDIGSDVREAVAELQDRTKLKQVTLFGLCSGAYAAMQTASQSDSIEELILVNQLVYFLANDDIAALADGRLRSAHELDYPRQTGRVANAWRRTLKLVSKASLLPGQLSSGHLLGGNLSAHLNRFADRGIKLSFLQSASDPARDALSLAAGKAVATLQDRGLANVAVFDDADHTFSSASSQAALQQWLSAHLQRKQ